MNFLIDQLFELGITDRESSVKEAGMPLLD